MMRPRRPALPVPAPEAGGQEGEDKEFPDRLLLALLDEARDLLAALGVRLSVVSIDEERAVLVSEPANGHVSVETACDFSRRALARVADAVFGSETEMVELRCGRSSEWPCTFSLEWNRPDPTAPESADIPSLEMLIAGRGPEARTAPGAAATPSTRPVSTGRQSPEAVAGPAQGPERAPPRRRSGHDLPPWLIGRWRSLALALPPWLKRRWWLLLLCVLAGTAGGAMASMIPPATHSASAEVVVATGAGEQGPGDANDADALALTDASILPSDQSLLHTVGREIGTSASSVGKHLSASVETGTSVILVSFQASAPSAAIRGANAVARAVTSANQASSPIPPGSLALVQLATSASGSGLLQTYGIPLGALLGLLIGLVVVAATERADPRADDVDDLAHATGTAASAYPGPVSLAELEQLIGRAGSGAPATTLVPLSDVEVAQTVALREALATSSARESLAFDVVGPLGSRDAGLSHGTGPTVLVVKEDAKLREVKASVQRLKLLGRPPVWAVLAVEDRPHDARR